MITGTGGLQMHTHMEIDEQLVKAEKIKTKPADISFEVFNIDGTKNKEVI